MADYFVKASGSDANDGLSWATAKATLHTATTGALAVATASGDRIFVKYDDAFILTATTTFTAANNIAVIAVSSTDYTTGTNWTPAVMDGTTGYIGHTSLGRSIATAGAFRVYWYGLCFRTAGSAGSIISLNTTADNSHHEFESCYFWQGDTSASAGIGIFFGSGSGGNIYVKTSGCRFRLGASVQRITIQAQVEIVGGSIVAGAVLTTVFSITMTNVSVIGTAIVSGLDLSSISTTATILANLAVGPGRLQLDNCKLPASWTGAWLATQTTTNKGGGAITAFNCSTGDTHYEFAYADPFGVLTAVTTPYFDTGAKYDGTNAVCWKIVTTANCSYYTPFVSPWIEKYHSGTSAITPYLEILRNDSTTAFNNDQVWGEFSVQATSGSVLPVFKNDRKALEASAASQANGAGLASWTGESGTAWSGKVDSDTSVTPAEIGMLRARVCVGATSTTVYVDPFIRT